MSPRRAWERRSSGRTIEALGTMIPYWKKHGYRFVAILKNNDVITNYIFAASSLTFSRSGESFIAFCKHTAYRRCLLLPFEVTAHIVEHLFILENIR